MGPDKYGRTLGVIYFDGCVNAELVRGGWSANQMRHTAGTEICRQFGLEAAQVIFGHSRADVTQVYAERDLVKAADIARQVG